MAMFFFFFEAGANCIWFCHIFVCTECNKITKKMLIIPCLMAYQGTTIGTCIQNMSVATLKTVHIYELALLFYVY